MTVPRTEKGHDWTFVAAARSGHAPTEDSVALVIAVCRKCGLVRAEAAAPGREARIDLTGAC